MDFNVCDGTNVYTFVPQLENTLVLTPKASEGRGVCSCDLYVYHAQKVHTTITANGPLVWEVAQTVNSVSCHICDLIG